MDKKQLTLFPELDLKSDEPIIHDGSSGKFINKFVEKKNSVPVRKPNAVPPKTKTIQKFANGSKPNVRVERLDERLERMFYEYEDGPKPKHYDNPNIVDYENIKKRPKPFDNNDPSTYPSNRDQRQKISSWDLIVDTAKTPEEKKEVREVLQDAYKSNPKNLTEKELKLIGKHPSQQPKLVEIKPVEPKVPDPMPVNNTPQISLEQFIKEEADKKLKQEQDLWDQQFGNQGLAKLLRPE